MKRGEAHVKQWTSNVVEQAEKKRKVQLNVLRFESDRIIKKGRLTPLLILIGQKRLNPAVDANALTSKFPIKETFHGNEELS